MYNLNNFFKPLFLKNKNVSKKSTFSTYFVFLVSNVDYVFISFILLFVVVLIVLWENLFSIFKSLGLFLVKLHFFNYFLIPFLVVIIIIICAVLVVAFFTLLERKFIGAIQRRRGPNVVGFEGILQPFADALKLIIKESVAPLSTEFILFIFAPIVILIISFSCWTVVPFYHNVIISDIDLNVLFLFALSSLGVYGVIIAGWSSNSKYAFLGGLRTAAQMISYEVCFGLVMLPIFVFSRNMNLLDIVNSQIFIWNVFVFWPLFILMLIVMLAETNRTPFDLPEAEAELVAGYNVEYSGMSFAFFFLAEYSNMLVMSFLVSILFLGGWEFYFLSNLDSVWLFAIKIVSIMVFFVWVRATVPRYRYDQLMKLCWKRLLPVSIGLFLLYTSYFYLLTEFNYYFYTFASYPLV